MILRSIILSCFNLFIFYISVYPQTDHTVEVNGSSFTVNVANRTPKFIEQKTNEFTIKDYYEYTDPSNEASYKLPFVNVYLAIPQNSTVELTNLQFDSEFEEKTIPKLNPAAVLNDSVINYIEKDFSQASGIKNQKTTVQIESYFWFREFYIVQIIINTHNFQIDQSKIEVLSNISFRVDLPPQFKISNNSPIKIRDDFDKAVKNLIANWRIAEQFRNNSTFSLPDTTGNWIDYNSTYLKIGVGDDAIFRITKSNLESLGINTNLIDPRTFKIFESGRQVKLFVDGEDDGVFGDNDFIEYWGQLNYPDISHRVINEDNEEYNEYLNRYTDSTFYFLTWGGDNGLRTDSIDISTEGINDTIDYFSQLLHFESQSFIQLNDNNEVANQTANWFKNKAWYWNFVFSQRTFNFTLTDIYPGKNASIFGKVVSFAANVVSNAHQVKLSLNNTLLDSNYIDRFKQLVLSGNINSSDLISGSNQIKFENIPNGGIPNSLTVDWYDVEYPRHLKLINDSLYFKVPTDISNGLKIINVGDANSPEYNIYKIVPEFKIVTGYSVIDSKLLFADTVSAGDEYYILATNKNNSPNFITVKSFSNLRNNSQQTDYIGITHPVFINQVQSYIQSISSLFNLSTSVFKVDDIFDEFSYGYPYPEGIRLFLNVLYNNLPQQKPSYLTLLGDGNYDYKYVRDPIAGLNYIPAFGYPVGDNWFTIWDLSGVPIPQLKVGRIPFNNPDELEYYLGKIENNESKPFDEWNKRYLFFSGGVSDSELEFLRAANDDIINQWISPRPIAGNYTHFYKTGSPRTDFGPYTADEIETAISSGSLFISYIGHSGTATWDNSINATNQLYNDVDRNPLITDFGCSTNKYAEPDIICFGERFLFNSTGQALAYVGNSSLGFSSTAVTASKYFYENLVVDSLSEVGNAHLFSKIKLFNQQGNSGVNRVYSFSNVILGDPAVRIKIPKLPNFKISSPDVILSKQLITDDLDSTEIKIAINNLGLAEAGMLDVSIVHLFNSEEIDNSLLAVPVPSYSDTLNVWISTKNKPGIHILDIDIDPDDQISEIYEDDNSLSYQFNVFSNSLRDFLTSRIENSSIQTLNILNPTTFDSGPFSVEFQVSTDENFSNPTTIISEADTFTTEIILPQLSTDLRYFIRYRIHSPEHSFSGVKSFYNNYDEKFLLIDSLAFANQNSNNLNWENDSIKIVLDSTNISVLSAGWYSGATCVIAKDGVNLLSNTFFAGMGIAVFDNISLEIDTVTWFTLFGQPGNVEALASLIDSIPFGKIVVMGVADDARNNLSTHLKDAIKSLGSSKIDSLEFRGSWALIGYKGAPIGSVIEEVQPALPPQSIFLDTSFVFQTTSGFYTTNEIGPASYWKDIEINEELPGDASSEYLLFGKSVNGQIDSIRIIDFENSIADISDIDADQYPHIILQGNFEASSDNESPRIKSLSIDFKSVPELGTNYQVVSSTADTILIGEDVKLNFYVYNVGEVTADTFKIKVDVINDDNSRNTIFETMVDSIQSGERKYFEVTHNTSAGTGSKTFLINIDSDQEITELFEDNNFYRVPFYVKQDTSKPTLTIAFDGMDILDGDYISPNPEIKIELSDQSLLPITDTSAVTIFLNDDPVYYADNQSTLTAEFNAENPKAVVTYTPELSDGEYVLKVFGQNSLGSMVDSAGVEKQFVVSNEVKLLNVYNYPNPTSGETHFTFKLTQIPDELKIKIYTIAGRLIKELSVPASDLRFDFNKIYWNGKDEDGDDLANGVYLYKVIITAGDKTEDVIQKLAIVR